ncbi:GntR family transcriptional regulator [Mesorhizobium ciceri]|uniref:GntR family transcriptional regulator n=2 Tax=Phyllobacteriaceae TaxID=69277 RepID=UPI0007A95D13|nr:MULTISPECIES: GntR family transcriptional regulator [Mesorhizobium]AMY03794.1 GntR family transcriptional regulator [Mesorhizobium ciceri biovar biserrulae]ARP67686.1 GntR family transcriptional regulator [Mesorhizobium sp. WSM1497]MBZ9721275.1 GntR family transcriptional regulator [Mesorhizobium sp. AD1-1]MBZ9891211.1 GntR family transcriptional regulator [Mesorhizobium sp. BR1-1-3]RUX69728.1 GntR family transcriptional regulator [Mesorhizobium sp. M7A.F.Ca.US.005.03.1.1]
MSSRSQTIADTLTRAIIDHRLVPGCKLGERELAEIFDVSRIVVRQALIRLADDGLAQIERNRGAFVARPSMQEAMEIYDALTLVEQGVAAQLSDRLGPAGWAELRQHVERQRQAVAAGNDALADVLGQEFHTVFVRLSRNKVMQEIHAQLVRRTTLLRSLISADFDYCNLLDDHSRVVDLLEKGRLKQAMDLIDTHHRTVVRGYIMDREVFPEMTPAEALAPYLDGKADGATISAGLRQAKPSGNGDGAAHAHVHLPNKDRASTSRASTKKTNRGLPT